MTKKGTTDLHLCVDYWVLNTMTIKNQYPVPSIDALLDWPQNTKYFTKIDLCEAFHLLRIRKNNKWKTAFRTLFGLFEFLVMPFGLCNTPASFQSYIDQALQGLEEELMAYLDDILIFGIILKELHTCTRCCLLRLQKHSLFAKLKKCKFEVTTVRMLGFIVDGEGISMEPKRINTISDWPVPKTLKQVQEFIGFINFYHWFIYNLSGMMKPIIDLTRKNK